MILQGYHQVSKIIRWDHCRIIHTFISCYCLEVKCAPKFHLVKIRSPGWYSLEVVENLRGGHWWGGGSKSLENVLKEDEGNLAPFYFFLLLSGHELSVFALHHMLRPRYTASPQVQSNRVKQSSTETSKNCEPN